MTKYAPYIACLLLLLALAFSVSECQDNKRAAANTYTLLQDAEKKTVDAQGRVTTSKQSLVLQAKEFTRLKSITDQQIRTLQLAVKAAGKKTTAATVFRTVTMGKATGRTDSIVYVVKPDTTQEMPVYYGKASGPGIQAWVRAAPDSVELLSYRIQQEYTVAFADGKVNIKALNTGTEVDNVRSFEVPPTKHRRGLFFGLGALVPFILLLL